jgi:hypothetical protein
MSNDIPFPILKYEGELNENLNIIKYEFPFQKLEDSFFFADLIKDGVFKIENKHFTGYVIPYLMTKTTEFLNEILEKLGYGNTLCDYENSLTLLHLSLNLGLNINININLRNFMTTATEEEIIKKYEETTNRKWIYTVDRASIYFILFNNCSLPIMNDYTKYKRYKELLNYDIKKLYQLYKYLYDYNNSFLSPIRYMCCVTNINELKLEKYLDYSNNDLINLMIKIEFIPIDYILYRDYHFYQYSSSENFIVQLYKRITKRPEILIKCFLRNLSQYKNVIDKHSNGKKIQKLLFPVDELNIENLNTFTDLELLNYYKPELNYKNRKDLINNIKHKLLNFHWRLNHPYNQINNDNHIIIMNKREITDDNPLYSYGTLLKYESYNLDELILSFNEKFQKPDSYDTFSYNSIIQLKNIITNEELLNKINNGLQSIQNIKLRVDKLNQMYNSFDIETQNKAKIFLLDLLFLGFYCRYWKGIGHAFPYIWKDRQDKEKYIDKNNNKDSLHYLEREIIVGKKLCTLLVCENNHKLQDWKQLLFRIDCNWQTGKITFGTESLLELGKIVQDNKFCISNFTDIMIKSSYMLFKLVLEYDENDINELILKQYPQQKHKINFEKMTDSTHKDPSLKFVDF